MKIVVLGTGVRVTNAIRTHIERRIAFALNRHQTQIRRVTVRLSRGTAPEDRAAKRCEIEVRLSRTLRVQDADADVVAAVDRAVDRVARALARAAAQQRLSEETGR